VLVQALLTILDSPLNKAGKIKVRGHNMAGCAQLLVLDLALPVP
jgi:rRNA pseudouridine-1189 N-methylase Emg1 (Nep1/Mra1 family)